MKDKPCNKAYANNDGGLWCWRCRPEIQPSDCEKCRKEKKE